MDGLDLGVAARLYINALKGVRVRVYVRFESIFAQILSETRLLEASKGMLNVRE